MGSPYVHLLEQVNSIIDTDYGDYMRKVNNYLTELLENKTAVMTPAMLEKIIEIQNYIQFTPNWDVSMTQNKLLKDAENLIYLEALNSL